MPYLNRITLTGTLRITQVLSNCVWIAIHLQGDARMIPFSLMTTGHYVRTAMKRGVRLDR